MSESSLKDRTASGLMWGFLNNGTMQLLGALFGILLLRLLSPSDYGKIAMLTVFATVASAIQESGFTAALCNLKERTDRDYNAVFWFNVLMGAFLYLLLFCGAPLISRFYGDPELTWLARYMFLGFLITSWGATQRAWMFIHLRTRETCFISLWAMLVSGTVSVVMAYAGMAYWGLATQNILYVAVNVLLNWYYSPWRPTLHIDLRPAWHMFSFSSKLLLTTLFEILNAHAFGVLLGRFFGDYQAGLYSNARKWDDMCMNTINGMVTGVAQPVLTQVRDEHDRYRQVFRKMLRFVCFISFPCLLGMGLIAREFLLIVGGTKWLESAELLSMLSVFGAFWPVATLYNRMVVSRGRSGINLVNTVALCVVVWIGLVVLHPWGLRTMVVFFVCVNVLWLVVWQTIARRLIGLRFRHAVQDVLPFFVFSVAVMTVAWLAARPISNLWLSMLVKVVVAVTLYAGILWVSGAKIMREAVSYFLQKGQ
ncbi:MAG: lipopolysaccharide biosynthesis protein [Bacteroidaceae bacterium]|nr:lipopolysaccharide biosynthesis protein [Bacteroidaceae bacterium]